jgi:uncharacterized protein (UPF0332 family)
MCNSNQLKTLISYRIEQAHETLHEAQILFNECSLRGTVNRAYYAMFYAVLGLIATSQFGTSKHSGVISLFDREFVKKGIFPKEFSRSLHKAFDLRQTYDYGEAIEIDQAMAEKTFNNAKSFISAIETYLSSQGYLSNKGWNR